jgi:hypothetical protein
VLGAPSVQGEGVTLPPPLPKLHWSRSLLNSALLDAFTPSAWKKSRPHAMSLDGVY